MALDALATTPAGGPLSDTYRRVADVIGHDRAVELGMKVWQEKRPPSRSRRGRAGVVGVLYVPKRLADRRAKRGPSAIFRLASAEDAARLIQTFGGEMLRFTRVRTQQKAATAHGR